MEFYWPIVLSPGFQLGGVVLIGAAAIESLVVLWAAASRQPWFVRALAVWIAVASLVPIRAFEPAVIFAGNAAILAAGFAAARGVNVLRQERRAAVSDGPRGNRFRFSLRDVFLLTLLVGLWLALLVPVAKHSRQIQWLSVGASLVAISSISVAAHFMIAGRRKLLAAILLLGTIGISGVLFALAADWRTWEIVGVYFGDFALYQHALVATILTEFAGGLCLFLGLWRVSVVAGHSGGRRWAARGGLAVISVALSMLLAIVYWRMLWLTPLPPKFASPENHYERIAAIADEVRRLNPGESSLADVRTGSVGAAARAQSLEALYRELFPLLDAPNFVPLDPVVQSQPRQDFNISLSDIQTWRSLARSLAAEGKSAAASGEPERAAEFALANLRLGSLLCRGGTIVEALVGCAFVGTADHQFSEIRDKVSDETARRIIRELERSRTERENVESLMVRDQALWERTGGWQARLQIVLAQMQGGSVNTDPSSAYVRGDAIGTQIQTHLALRLYQHQHGHLPETLVELVPDFLPEVPLDVYSRQPLVYRALDADFVLYSVGRDGIDNGGRFTDWGTQFTNDGYDFDLDTLTRR